MEPIAIVGMGCLFPQANNPEVYWKNLCQKKDCSTPISEHELGISPDYYYSPESAVADTIHYNKNGYIRDFKFNSTGYNLSEDELNSLDDVFKWTLYSAEQALIDSGYRHQKKCLDKTGLVIGNIGMPTHSVKHMMTPFYHQLLEPYIQELLKRPDFKFDSIWPERKYDDVNVITGGHIATVSSLALGLSGPTYALDAACASAFYAIDLAIEYLNNHQVDMMLAGAVCCADHIYIGHGFNILQAYPDKGESIPLDNRSQGLKSGEGSGIVALKRYSDAIANGDKIYGVVEAVGLSNDAGAKHILVPDIKGQRLALERAYRNCSSDIDYLECHATGTPVGDQIELNSVESFFAEQSKLPLIGANKANNGHMLTASGMAGLFKVLLAMHHGEIPATLGVEQFLSTTKGRLSSDYLVRSTQSWPVSHKPKRAAINAFGFGGVNAHLVISEDHATLRHQKASAVTQFSPSPVAIVGLGMHLAETEQTGQLAQTLHHQKQFFSEVPDTRWMGMQQHQGLMASRGIEQPPQGAWIEHFKFDCKHYRLPPNVVSSHILSHVMTLPVAERAFLDAGYKRDEKSRNIAVIVAGGVDYGCFRYQARNEISWQLQQSLTRCGIELNDADLSELKEIVKDSLFPAPFAEGTTGGIGNIVASRIAAHLHLNGPSFSLCSEENAVFKAIELSQFMLARQAVDAVMVVSIGLAGTPENVFWDHQSLNANQPVGDGCAAIMLKREDSAIAHDNEIYAVVEGLSISHQPDQSLCFEPSVSVMAENVRQALRRVGCDANQIDYLEIYAGARPQELDSELTALAQVYQRPREQQPVTLGTIKAHYGHLGAASGLFSIIKTVVQFSMESLPALPEFCLSPLMRQSATHFGSFPRLGQLWKHESHRVRRASINHFGIDRAYSHLILRESVEGRRATLNDVQVQADKPLLIDVYTGRQQSIADIILSEENKARFAYVAEQQSAELVAVIDGGVRTIALDDSRHLARHAYTQLKYLQLESTFNQLLQRQIARLLDEPAQEGHRPVIFDYEQLVELTNGCVAKVLGREYQEADQYLVRTRMPSPPYMFVSRINALSAQKGKLEPGFIEWEYDIPVGGWYIVNDRSPSFVALESSHAMIVAFTVIGCDMMFKGQLCYRAVDSKTTVYSDMPKAGETMRGRVNMTSVVRAGGVTLIHYEYFCYVGERLVFKLEANSGFFGLKDIQRAKPLDTSSYFANATKQVGFVPVRHTDKTSLNESEINALMSGDIAGCFGPSYQREGSRPICNPSTQMVERIASIEQYGGAFGLGQMIGEVDIDPDHFIFKAHFKNDPVMPGTFLVEGCEQMVSCFIHYLGFNSDSSLVPFSLCDHQHSARFRGEVKCERETLRYRLTCKSIDATYTPSTEQLESATMTFIVEMIYRGNVIGLCDNLGAGFKRVSIDDSVISTYSAKDCDYV
ncbi:MAG: hypothetical protein CENE_03166 [Candidatus Celerinatantimonas neptuna]|nr:MAG: hypothetical protein CENE_03166 [Candidatus Celerinatantimonas neptuna]